MQCAASSAQPRVVARPPANRITATVPSLRQNMKNEELTAVDWRTDFLRTSELYLAASSPAHSPAVPAKPSLFFVLFFPLLEHVRINLNRAARG